MGASARIERRRRWSVAGIGVLLCGVVVGGGVVSYVEWTTPHYLQIGVPLLLSVGLAAYGKWLVHSDVPTEWISRIALWVLVGAVGVGSFASWEMFTHVLEGEPVLETSHELLNGLTEGAVVGGLIGYYDARQKAQYAEAEQAQRAISASTDGIAVIDESGEYRTANRAFAEIHGYDDPESLAGESWRGCYTEAEADRFEEEILPRLSEEGSWRGQLVGRRRDGDTFPQEITLSRGPDGGFVSVVREIRERREYEDRLAALNETSRELMAAESEAAIAGIIVETAHRLLDWPLAVYWSYDAEEDLLVPIAATDRATRAAEAADPEEGIPSFPDGTIDMEIFRGGEPTVIDDYRMVDNPATRDITLGTILALPVGEHGLLNIGSPAVEDVAQPDRQLSEILAQNAQSALDRLEHQRTLAMREQRLRTIVENAPVVLFAVDRSRTVTLQVGKGLDEIGVEQNQMVGEPIDDLFGDSPVIVDAIDRSLDGEPTDVTVDLWGQTYQVWYQPVETGGEVTSVIGVAMDVTERHRRERGIRALHDATREMMRETDRETICRIAVDTGQRSLDLPMSAIWLRADDPPRLEPVAWSDRAGDLFGEPPVFEPGGSISWSVYEEGEPRLFGDVRDVEGRHNPETEMRSELIVPVGEYGVLNSGSTDPGRFDETDVALARLLAANTRAALERADREDALRRQTDQMEFFNSILRHDVLNGMTVIRSRAEFLAEDLEGQQLRDAETIVDWSDEITTIVQRVRTVLETLVGAGGPRLESIELSAVLRSEVDRIRATYPEVEFETDIPEAVTAQATELLGEVFGNVLTNAIHHNDTDGLRVSVTVDDREDPTDPVTVRIADNGRGVPDEVKESIFRREETGHAKSTGSGFGLFFVDAMVTEYGGDVRVEDNDPQGAEFVIELPTTQ